MHVDLVKNVALGKSNISGKMPDRVRGTAAAKGPVPLCAMIGCRCLQGCFDVELYRENSLDLRDFGYNDQVWYQDLSHRPFEP